MIKDNTKVYIGAPCPHGHPGLRYQRDHNCVECKRLRGVSDNKKAHAKAKNIPEVVYRKIAQFPCESDGQK